MAVYSLSSQVCKEESKKNQRHEEEKGSFFQGGIIVTDENMAINPVAKVIFPFLIICVRHAENSRYCNCSTCPGVHCCWCALVAAFHSRNANAVLSARQQV